MFSRLAGWVASWTENTPFQSHFLPCIILVIPKAFLVRPLHLRACYIQQLRRQHHFQHYFFFSTTGFQEHLKVLRSPAPAFCQFSSKLRLLQLFHFSHLCTLFLTLCKKDMTREFWQGFSGLFLLGSFPGHNHMILKDLPLFQA